jgi:uncharacterized membrane protein YgcG
VTGSRRFDPEELRATGTTGDPGATDAELADALSMARELETMSASDLTQPTADFEDRVMAAIATESAPRVVIRPRSAVRGGRVGAIALAVRESWAVAFSGGRPVAVRAQAFAIVLVAVLAVGLLTTAGALTVGALLQGRATPPPTNAPPPTFLPTPTNPPAISPGPTVAVSPSPTETAEPTETPEPTETARPTGTDDHGGGSGGNSGPGGGGSGSDGGSDSSGGVGSDGSDGGSTPKTETPRPIGTDDHGGSGGGSGGDDGGTSGGSEPSGS